MTSRLNPYLSISGGRARDAIEFYRSVLGGEATINTFGEAGMVGVPADQVMHGMLETDAGYTLMVADAPDEMVSLTIGDNVSISISGAAEDAEALRAHFEGLAVDGEVDEPLARAPWGAEFGMLTDKFGIHWMVNIAAPES